MNYIVSSEAEKSMRYRGFIFKLKPRYPAFNEAIKKYQKSVNTDQTTSGPVKKKLRVEIISKEIFIVHGHNDEIKEKVARFIEKLNLVPIILHEQSNNGRTIIEKFEDHAKVGFAIILMTDDDFGGKAGESPAKLRARQNVVLEHGYFLGALGRDRVCALYIEGVELPSDLSGILYIPLDDKDAWKFRLAKEIKAAGIEIDMNLAL